MLQEYWQQFRTWYFSLDDELQAPLNVGLVFAGVALLFVVRNLLCWLIRPWRSQPQPVTPDYNAIAIWLQQQGQWRTEEPEAEDEDEYDDEDDALTLAIEKLADANAKLADVADLSLKTLQEVTVKTQNTVQEIMTVFQEIMTHASTENRRATVRAIKAIMPAGETHEDDDDE